MESPRTDQWRTTAAWVRSRVQAHHEWFAQSLPMIASENLISPLSRELLASDFHDRYAEGHPGKRYYQGCRYIDEVELRCEELARTLFRADYADVRPISGTTANLGVLFALTKPGDTISVVNVAHGAHISSADFGAVGVRGLHRVEYPFDLQKMIVDVDGARKVIRDAKPKVAWFGQSVFLFPTPIDQLQDAFEEVGCAVVYDAAHVLGLIAGGQFQDPLRQGAHVVNGSTHKTLPGPQHGLVVAKPRDDKMRRKLDFGMFPGVLSNHHLHSMAALAVSLAEFLEFGEAYAQMVVRNAQVLGSALHSRGVKVLCAEHGFTKSHTLALDVAANGGGADRVEALEQANIIANKNLLPWDDPKKAMHPSGIRLGSQELTRLGMGPAQMEEVAQLIARVIVDHEDPAVVRTDVATLRRDFQSIHYCFTPDVAAYRYHKLVP